MQLYQLEGMCLRASVSPACGKGGMESLVRSSFPISREESEKNAGILEIGRIWGICRRIWKFALVPRLQIWLPLSHLAVFRRESFLRFYGHVACRENSFLVSTACKGPLPQWLLRASSLNGLWRVAYLKGFRGCFPSRALKGSFP